MDAIIGVNAKVEIQDTIGTPIAVTAVDVNTAGTAVATTSGAHGYSNGDVVFFTVSEGMVELDGQAVRIANASGSNFDLEGLDVSTYSAWTTGTVTKVTSFQTLASAQNVTAPNPTPNKLDKTVLLDKSKQYVFGLQDAPDGSITGLFNPGGGAEQLIFAATGINGSLVMRCDWSGGTKHSLWNAFVSGGEGFNMAVNQVATATISFTPIKRMMHYST